MYTRMTQINPAIHLFRERLLPINGAVVARVGQKVNPNDVVAEVSLPARHDLVDVVRIFGLPSAQAATALIKRKVGETVAQNDLLAETGGLFSRMIRCQTPGKIVSINNGQILIETQSETLNLKANYAGVVSKVIANRGVEIEINCLLVQGAWGNHKLTNSNLIIKSSDQRSEIEVNSLDVNIRGMILLGGTCNDAKILDLAATLPIGGMILGTMPAALRENAIKQPYPILLVDGFGREGMNERAWKLLAANKSRELTLNAQFKGSESDDRPEVLIPLSDEAQESNSATRLTRGQLVRIHAAPLMGKIGIVEKVLPGLTQLNNGLRVCAASVMVDNKERIIIPVSNLDVIGFTS